MPNNAVLIYSDWFLVGSVGTGIFVSKAVVRDDYLSHRYRQDFTCFDAIPIATDVDAGAMPGALRSSSSRIKASLHHPARGPGAVARNARNPRPARAVRQRGARACVRALVSLLQQEPGFLRRMTIAAGQSDRQSREHPRLAIAAVDL